jgi:hypothetical protein
MGFTVTRPGGITTQRSSPTPGNCAQGQTWDGFVGSRAGDAPTLATRVEHSRKAETFAAELRQRTGMTLGCRRSQRGRLEGPLSRSWSSLRQGDGLTLGLHPWARRCSDRPFRKLQESFPTPSSAPITGQSFPARGLAEWVRLTLPVLTGLSREQLEELGYSVVDSDDGRAVVFVPPPIPSPV